ncbi:PREDICTED: aluminum-activated malate transporter 9-like [Nelumbo nucifera]|uniref:Aluminum-activated malate transporter 9-like n=2 Tax=Nelumbo nucifera TaxID=4432 RepID=A0A1U8B017_NELNU|nr:PREDICTED: aluminum-activated malate transporter 9-like [Nelumbo nucifera]DAD49103.1 TPA_asm: hypothetical protein HUJ06_019040 [Nelumbo nucifera]
MVPKMRSFKYYFAQRSKERLLSQSLKEGYSEIGLGSMDGHDGRTRCWCSNFTTETITNLWTWLQQIAFEAWNFGRSDPRKIISSAKMGLALVLISLIILFKDLSQNSVWAIMTVVVVFEFSVGATLSRGYNRGLGTFSAGAIALVMAELSILTGNLEEVFIIISILITAFCVNFVKMYPPMKQYEYGFRVFLLTYCCIMVSGETIKEFFDTAVSRLLLIALGAAVCLAVTIFVYPIWAGDDLHNLVVKNFMNVATSLEGCVNGYLQCVEYDRVPSKILTYEAYDDPAYSSYRSAVNSTNQEDTLVCFAIWEPPHGRYRMFKYPWKNYVKVSDALRHCAFMVMALHGSMLSEIQAPAERRLAFNSELQRVGTEGAKVLRELGNKVNKMEKLSPGDILSKVHEAAEELQKKVDKKSYLLVNSAKWEIGRRAKVLSDPEDTDEDLDDKTKFLAKSLSETVLDLRSVKLSKSWNVHNTNTSAPTSLLEDDLSENMFKKQISWPSRFSLNSNMALSEESSTYESASALSLATFFSLLMELVARLQNLVDSFKELSEEANFNEPSIDPLVPEEIGGI